MDIACGRGRNSLLLAQHDFAVDALDISSEGLRQAEQAASRQALKVNWQCCDVLQEFELPRPDYQLILMVHFVAPELLRRLPAYLAPGGWLMVEQHLQWPSPVAGPSDRFRVARGEILTCVPQLKLVAVAEGEVAQENGAKLALSRMLARRMG